MVNSKKIKLEESEIPRRRGRPAGKNRIPLSREERRARNAQYERERRNETAEVMSQLTEAANCDPNISNAELLATVIYKIQRASRKNFEDITELEHVNANLEAQIAKLQGRLGLDDAALELDHEDTATDTIGPHSRSKRNMNSKNVNSENHNLRKQRKKRKRSERLTSESIKPEKRMKIKSETCAEDSGIEMRGHTVSPPAVCDQDKMNMQFWVKMEQHQLPEEITEEPDHGESQEHTRIELQTELYNQIYKSESHSSEESMTKFVATLSAQSQSIPSIERLTRSLIVAPPIVPPQQIPPDSKEHKQSDVMSLQNVELPCDLNLKNECDFLQQNDDQAPTLDFLTDAEKGLLSDWIGANFLESSEFCDGSHL